LTGAEVPLGYVLLPTLLGSTREPLSLEFTQADQPVFPKDQGLRDPRHGWPLTFQLVYRILRRVEELLAMQLEQVTGIDESLDLIDKGPQAVCRRSLIAFVQLACNDIKFCE
jgi:hypothetical protein